MISVILPCYNEKENISALVLEINKILESDSHEIIIVDDNSPDGTYAYARALNLPFLKVLLNKGNASLGSSILVGIKQASGEHLIIMDSDFNHRPEDIPIFLANLKYFDCVSASRFVYGGRMGSKLRYLCSWIFNIFSRIITRTMVTDSLFGFIAVRKEILSQLPLESIFYGYGDYCIRLMYYLQKNSYSILQIPGILGSRRAGKGNTKLIRTFVKYLKAVLILAVSRK